MASVRLRFLVLRFPILRTPIERSLLHPSLPTFGPYFLRSVLRSGLLRSVLGGVLVVVGLATDVLAQDFLVSSRNTNSVKRYDLATGNFLGDFVDPGDGGLSLPQEVIWHPDGFLLVTGRGQNAIKKYDGQTGDYLGNFTTGYALDNPTKTNVGPDGLLYVSQWGAVQNKVARFDLQTGVFVDEFTEIGVPNGGGHAWDADGNLYVAQYGNGANGKVVEFDPDGAYLGVFVANGPVRGPINVWFDDSGNLVVVDWTLGDILVFDGGTGSPLSPLVTTTTNLEGTTYDADGNLYICDWSGNQVFRRDANTGVLAPFITSGGLVAPNSILIRPASPASAPSGGSDTGSLRVYPNPSPGDVHIEYTVTAQAPVRLDVLNVLGQRVATVGSGERVPGVYMESWDGRTDSGGEAARGTYFISLQVADRTVVRKVTWR
ncbi:MAG: T9SS type A sorting domain-containing protein [Candidatus Eisenbacteria bacterium]|uniref:T9SS type A sorting domain-containing protein n=1 Tax=Eiseniibacteriota bacterium TaxID=2212470 RepID=A0A956M0S4_UNCEI|nr:T9SS type A sorting domain-containing protein [Candidatus Eisenbacteria bacterium]